MDHLVGAARSGGDWVNHFCRWMRVSALAVVWRKGVRAAPIDGEGMAEARVAAAGLARETSAPAINATGRHVAALARRDPDVLGGARGKRRAKSQGWQRCSRCKVIALGTRSFDPSAIFAGVAGRTVAKMSWVRLLRGSCEELRSSDVAGDRLAVILFVDCALSVALEGGFCWQGVSWARPGAEAASSDRAKKDGRCRAGGASAQEVARSSLVPTFWMTPVTEW